MSFAIRLRQKSKTESCCSAPPVSVYTDISCIKVRPTSHGADSLRPSIDLLTIFCLGLKMPKFRNAFIAYTHFNCAHCQHSLYQRSPCIHSFGLHLLYRHSLRLHLLLLVCNSNYQPFCSTASYIILGWCAKQVPAVPFCFVSRNLIFLFLVSLFNV